MAGNVWEWTSSFFDDSKDRFVLRGGSWQSQALFCRCAFRGGGDPFYRDFDVGIRCARTITL